METFIKKNTIRRVSDYIPGFLQFVGTFCLLSVVCVSSSELPSGELSKQWWWLSRMGIVYAVCIWLSFLFCPKDRKNKLPYYTHIVTWVLILLAGWEAILGLRQIYGFSESNHSLFTITGTFFNPGPYSGYLAMVFPVCLYEYYRLKKIATSSLFAKMGHYVALAVLLFISCILPAGMSRSAWLSAIISGLFVAWWQNDWGRTMKQIWHRNKRKVIYCSVLVGFCVSIGLALIFYLKKDSADGRLFMWRMSLRAISEHPFIGYGTGGFAYAYGSAQEVYFAKGEYAEWEERVAGSPEYAFNEYLQVAVEWGVPLLFFCIAIIVLCLWSAVRSGQIGVCGGVISLAVFSFFSYPLQLPAFTIAFIVLLFVCVAVQKRIGLMVFSIGIVFWSLFLWSIDNYDATKKWTQARILYNVEAHELAKKEYSSLHFNLKNRAEFMFEYGRCLHKLGEYDKSNDILQETSYLTPDPMVFNVMGKNYQMKGEYEKAEELFIRSTYRLPGRIYPYYLLVKLYNESGYFQLDKLKGAAQIVLTKEPKVQSTAIKEMREEVKCIVRQYY